MNHARSRRADKSANALARARLALVGKFVRAQICLADSSAMEGFDKQDLMVMLETVQLLCELRYVAPERAA